MGLFNGEVDRQLGHMDAKIDELARNATKTNVTLEHVVVRLDRMDLNGHTDKIKLMADEWPLVKEVILDKRASHLAWRTVSFGLGIVLAVVSIVYFAQNIRIHIP